MRDRRTRVKSGRPRRKNEQGSFLAAGALFLLLFFIIAAFAVDLSRAFLMDTQLQGMADRAALAGAQALNQYSSEPDLDEAKRAVIRYVKTHMGPEYQHLYGDRPGSLKDNIEIHPYLDGNGDTRYRVAVIVHDQMESYFLPRGMFGDPALKRTAHAVAEAVPNYGSPPDCGVYVEEEASLSGRRFDASESLVCSNGDVDAGASQRGNMKGVYRHYRTNFRPPGNGIPDGADTTFKSEKTIPSFVHTSASQYDVNLSNFEDWDKHGVCNYGPAVKPMRTTESTEPDLEWSLDGRSVCVEKVPNNDGYDTYVILKTGDGGRIQHQNGNSVAIYSDQSVTFGLPEPYAFRMPIQGTLRVKFEGSEALLKSSVWVVADGKKKKMFQKGSNRNGDKIKDFETVYDTGTKLNFFIRVHDNGTGKPSYDHFAQGHHEREGKPWGKVEKLDDRSWRIGFEDIDDSKNACCGTSPDWDYNDQVIKIDVQFIQEGETNGKKKGNSGSKVQTGGGEKPKQGNENANGMGVSGGIFARGHIVVPGENYVFSGDPDTLGGLSLWSEENIRVAENNNEFYGIVAAQRNLTIGRTGGPGGPIVEGVLIAGNRFAFPSNSPNAEIVHDKTTFSYNVLENWRWDEQEPAFSKVVGNLKD